MVQAAQELARSVGLSSTEAAKIGNELVQRFEWKELRESAQQSYILEVKFTPVGHNWELYLSLGAERIPSEDFLSCSTGRKLDYVLICRVVSIGRCNTI